MLIIRRRSGEGITIGIGSGISIQVLEISPSRVKLGVVAPRDVPVQRSELIESVEENRRAGSSAQLDVATARSLLSTLRPN